MADNDAAAAAVAQATAAANAANAAAAAAAAAKPWYQDVAGVDDVIVGHMQNRGWDKKPAPEVAIEAIKQWKEAEKMVGVPTNQVLRLPKDAADEAGWNALWAKLGKPAQAKEYDFSSVKFSDGTKIDDNFTNTMRETAFRLHLPKDTAAAVTSAFAKYLDASKATENTEKQATLIEQKAALDKNWGPNREANMFVAKRAAAALGVAPETVAALENVIGYDKIMEMFRMVGSKIGEDRFVTGDIGGAGGVMTRDQAVAKKSELMSDSAWSKAYLAGDKAKAREMTALNVIISAAQQRAA